MKRMRISVFFAALLVGTGIILSPVFSQDAFSAERHSKKSSTTSRKKSGSVTQARKYTARNAKSRKALAAKRTTSKTLAEKSSEREIWLRRAKSSEVLTGQASWYGKDFHNKATASGLAYDMHTFTAAHRTLPMGTVVKVTDQNNGKSVMVCVTDRGPYVRGRIIDLSYAAAKQLGLNKKGVGKVELEVISDEHGSPLKKGQAYYVEYSGGAGKKKVGPFHAFADAAAMHEALQQAHPEAQVILGKDKN